MTEELIRGLIDRNDLVPEAMVSCLFTTTGDLDAEFQPLPPVTSGSTLCRCFARGRSSSGA